MSREYNPITEAMTKQPQFVEEVSAATARFFDNEVLEVLFKNKKREIKAFRDDENMTVYLFDKNGKKITVNIDQIHSFNKDSSIKEILYWQYKEKNGKVEDDLHMQTIIECVFEDKKKAKEPVQTTEEFEKALMDKFTTPEEQSKLKDTLAKLKAAFGDDFFKTMSEKKNIVCSTDVGAIQSYTELLNSKGYVGILYLEMDSIKKPKEKNHTLVVNGAPNDKYFNGKVSLFEQEGVELRLHKAVYGSLEDEDEDYDTIYNE